MDKNFPKYRASRRAHQGASPADPRAHEQWIATRTCRCDSSLTHPHPARNRAQRRSLHTLRVSRQLNCGSSERRSGGSSSIAQRYRSRSTTSSSIAGNAEVARLTSMIATAMKAVGGQSARPLRMHAGWCVHSRARRACICAHGACACMCARSWLYCALYELHTWR